MLVETAKQVGRPKFLLPTSEKAWLANLCSFVHRITSQGADSTSAPRGFWRPELATEVCLECAPRTVSGFGRGEVEGDVERRD